MSDTNRSPGKTGPALVVLAIALLAANAVLEHLLPDAQRTWMAGENGAVELGQFAVLMLAMLSALAFQADPVIRKNALAPSWLLLAAAGCFYVGMEEASWGQWFFHWPTPEGWALINDQQETNLHNTSSWFDQKPRALLEMGIIIGGIILPLLYRTGSRHPRKPWLDTLVPGLYLMPLALLAEAVRLEEFVLKLPGMDGQVFFFARRSSEIQEFCYYMFILAYIWDLRGRLHRNVQGTP
ncbi:MAG: hypothetical protein M3O22_08760 [Pseudomonadota bacterium]|nr:hypothetical protein [Pseudomonadota bacterium]